MTSDFVPVHHEGLTHPDGSLTSAGRLFHGNSTLKLGPDQITGPLLKLLSRLRSFEGNAETERIAWRIVDAGKMMVRSEPLLLLEPGDSPLYYKAVALERFNRAVAQHVLGLCGFLTFSRLEEFLRVHGPHSTYRQRDIYEHVAHCITCDLDQMILNEMSDLAW